MEGIFNLNNLNVVGNQVLTGKRNTTNDPTQEIRTAPTAGKVTLSAGFLNKSGFAPGDTLVFATAPVEIGGVAPDYPIAATFAESEDPKHYLVTKGISDQEDGNFGNKITDGPGAPAFSSASAWSSLRGSNEGSNFFETVKIYGFAVYLNDAGTAPASIIPVTSANAEEQEGYAGILVPSVDGKSIQYTPVETVEAALAGNPIYVLSFTFFEEKSERTSKEDGDYTSNNSEPEDAGDMDFE